MQKVFKKSFGEKKAGVTIFLTMLLAICASVLFALLEVARVKGLKTQAKIVSDLTIESMFAEYQKNIYEDYGILLLDESYMTGNFSKENLELEYAKLDRNNRSVNDMYRLELAGCEVTGCQYATDYGGAPFRRLVLKNQMLLQNGVDISEFEQNKQSYEDMESSNSNVEEVIENDFSACKQYQEEKNQIDDAVEWKKSPILSNVVRDEATLSNKAVDLSSNLEHRVKNVGNVSGGYEGEKKGKILFAEYLTDKMGCYVNVKEDHVMDYELEYILAGKSSDRENLEKVTKSLIKIRELSNISYLLGSPEKCTQAYEAALLLSGWTENPVIVEVAKWGILNAWAYQESILDVRALLEGRKISFRKTDAEWTLKTVPTPHSLSGFQLANHCERGWDYLTYLKFLLYAGDETAINYRSMDIIEVNTSKKEGIPIRMDHMAVYLEINSCYEANALFYQYVQLGNRGIKGFVFEQTSKYTYL